ncbi:ROK family transcriptional regulator, partial [Streptomyces zhihengii]
PSAARQLSVAPGALGGRAEVLGALALVLSEMGKKSSGSSSRQTAL